MNNSLFGKLEIYNKRIFIGSIEAGNGIEITAVVDEYILKKAKFRCFGCDSLRTTTCDFIDKLIGKDLRTVTPNYKSGGYVGCICPEDMILCQLLDSEVKDQDKKVVYLFDKISRYDVENMILLNDIYTLDRIQTFFNIKKATDTLNLRFLKILKRVIEEHRIYSE